MSVPANATLIDVRSPAEHHSGHVVNSKNIPLDALSAQIGSLNLKESDPIVVYCASGARAGVAASLLARAGFTNVTNAGGVMALAHMGIE